MVTQGSLIKTLYLERITRPLEKIMMNHTKFTNLSSIRLFNVRFTGSIVSSMSALLSSSSRRVENLQINDCTFDRGSFRTLADGIGSSRYLEGVGLSHIVEEDLKPVANILARTRSITFLEIVINFVKYKTGFKEVCDAIAKNQTLVYLALAEISKTIVQGLDKAALVIPAILANKVLRVIDIEFSNAQKPDQGLMKTLNLVQYDRAQILFSDRLNRFSGFTVMTPRPLDLKDRMVLESYRILKFCRLLAGCRPGEKGLKYPFEIIAQILTRGMITERLWIHEQLNVVIRCLLKRQSIGLVRFVQSSDRPFVFNETSLFVVCKRVLAEIAE